MVQRLFWGDAYLKDFEARVISISTDGGKFIEFDKTCFYPQGGGQPCDFGVISKGPETFNVLSVKKDGEKILHEIDKSGLNVGDKIKGSIDWDRRYRLMRMHTTAHLIACIINRETGSLITGNQLGTEESRIDFALQDFNKEKAQVYINKANQLIGEKLDVSSFFISTEEAKKDESLFKLAKGFDLSRETLRIVEIKGVDKQADGGTHVKNIGEIGKISLVKVENKGKDNRRIYFKLELPL